MHHHRFLVSFKLLTGFLRSPCICIASLSCRQYPRAEGELLASCERLNKLSCTPLFESQMLLVTKVAT